MYQKIDILIADAQPVYRKGLEGLLLKNSLVGNVFHSGNGLDVIGIIKSQKISLVFLDLDLPKLSGVECLRNLNDLFELSKLKVVMVSLMSSRNMVTKCFDLGAFGFLHKSANIQEIDRLLKHIKDDKGYYLPNSIRKEVFKSGFGENQREQKSKLNFSDLEIKILKASCLQRTNAEIAIHFDLPENTIKSHKHIIFRKMKVRNMVGALIFALEHNLISLIELQES